MKTFLVYAVMLAALFAAGYQLKALTSRVEEARVALETQTEYIMQVDKLMSEIQRNQERRDAEVKAYARELDKITRDNAEMRVLLDTVVPPDVLCGLRSCDKSQASDSAKRVD